MPGVGHAHSTRDDGAVGPIAFPGAATARERLVRAAGGAADAVVVPDQVHGARVAVALRDGARGFPATDGLVTAARGVPLLVQGADCPLVAFAAEDGSAVGVVHSGWRGTVARIAAEGLVALRGEGVAPSRTVAAVFPGIGPCCYEVGPEVRERFREAFGAAADAWFGAGAPGAPSDRARLDLRAAIVATLVAAGLARSRIDVVPGCTACGGALWSHRASGGGPERHGLCVVRRGLSP